MTRRYQAVWIELDGQRTYSICEVYLDDEGRLDAWTKNKGIVAVGGTWDELQRDIGRMYKDCWNWEPVAVTELQAGMTFKRRPT